MNTHELAKRLLEQPDQPLIISIDISTGEDDAENRAFGDPIELQNNGADTSILCEGCLNY